MRDKITNYNGCVSIFQPNSQKSFGTVSPIPVIAGPTNTLFYSWAGSVTSTSTPNLSFGTIDRWRVDNNQFKHDQWVLNSTGTASLIRISDVQKENIPDHHTSNLSLAVKNELPKWLEDLIEDGAESWPIS